MIEISTFVYRPGVQILISTIKGETIDVSNDITSVSLNRVLGPAVSGLTFALANGGRKYDGMFTPMDRIVCYMRRISAPILEFSGYLNTVPAFSAYPSSIRIDASCTLKLLQYFYWDPNTSAAEALFRQSSGADNSKFQDGNMAKRTIDLLTQVAGWPQPKIHIGAIPLKWFDAVSAIADKAVKEADALDMAAVVGSSAYSNGTTPIDSGLSSMPGVTGPGIGVMPATSGRCSDFGGGPLTSPPTPNDPGAHSWFGVTQEIYPNYHDMWYCLPGSSMIYTEHGPRAMREVHVGDMVWSVPMGEAPVLAAVTGKVATGQKSIIEIKTRGRSLRCTPDHRVLVLGREGSRFTRRSVHYEWVRAGDVIRGDVIVALSGVTAEASGDSPTPEQARIVGWLVADGSRGKYTSECQGSYGEGWTRWALCLNKEERPAKVAILREQGYEVDDNAARCCVGFKTTDLHPWAADVMTHKSPDRFIPEWVWTSPREAQEQFFEGLLDGDGSLGQTASTQGTMQVSMSSERLVRELHALAHLLGWGTGNIAKNDRRVGSYKDGEDWRFVCYRTRPWAAVPTSYSRNGLDLPDGLIGQTVVSVKATGEDDCWDLEVHGPGSFVAEGVVVHNCAMRWQYVQTNAATGLAVPGTYIPTAHEWWKGKDGWGRKILVVNPANNKAVVVRAADWGPNGTLNRAIDLSNPAMDALGAKTDDILHMGFAGEDAAVGPVAPSASTLAVAAALNDTSSPSGTSPSATGWGDSQASGYAAANLTTITAGGHTFSINKRAARRFAGFVNELSTFYKISDLQSYAPLSRIPNTDRPSNHAYGCAIDINPQENPWDPTGNPASRHTIGPTQQIISLAHSWGIGWGGEWHTAKDWMHFELLEGPESGSPAYRGLNPQTQIESGSPSALSINSIFVGNNQDVGVAIGNTPATAPTGMSDPATALLNVWQWLSTHDYSGQLLTGAHALANDTPIMQTVQQYVETSARHFCSAPNGDFIAWFPDYFDRYGSAGKMVISPVEIMRDFTVAWSDGNMKTHVFVTGSSFGSSTRSDAQAVYQIQNTAGIASVEMKSIRDLINLPFGMEWDKDGSSFLSRFGARPDFKAMENITGHRQEFFFAVQNFLLNWAQQFTATVSLTFMPEIFPGMILQFPTYGVQCYVQEVQHDCDMGKGGGFRTQVAGIAWASMGATKIKGLPVGGPLK